jgi:hypothetical protein
MGTVDPAVNGSYLAHCICGSVTVAQRHDEFEG